MLRPPRSLGLRMRLGHQKGSVAERIRTCYKTLTEEWCIPHMWHMVCWQISV